MGSQRAAPPPVLDLFGPGMFGEPLASPRPDHPGDHGADHGGDQRAELSADQPPVSRLRLRGRHVRPPGYSRVPIAPETAEVISVEEHLVLHVLRRRPVDLDVVQVAAQAALPPSVAAATLHELVRSGLARDVLVAGRLRFGLP